MHNSEKSIDTPTLLELLQAGAHFHRQGDLSKAETLYHQVLQTESNNPDALHLLGVLSLQRNHFSMAVDLITRAIAQKNDAPDFYNNLGLAFHYQGSLDDAGTQFHKAISLRPDYAEAHYNLGNVSRGRAQYHEAIVGYRAALSFKPDYPQAWNNLGLALYDVGEKVAAIDSYHEALHLLPMYAEAHNNLGVALQETGELDEALKHYREAVRHLPTYTEAFCNLGIASRTYRRLDDAVSAFQAALSLKPTAEIYTNLGATFVESGELSRALASFKDALSLDPSHADAYYNIGNILQDQEELNDAAAYYRQALNYQPSHVEALSKLLHLSQQLCDWSEIATLIDQSRRVIDTAAGAISPFVSLSMPLSAAQQLFCARLWVDKHLSPIAKERTSLGFHFSPKPKTRLHVGYLSADFRDHPVAQLIAELLELHSRDHFSISGYALSKSDESPIRRRIVQGVDHFVDLSTSSYRESARRIYNDGINILVDLMGYTKGSRTDILALRPAPIQVNYLGYPGTMGADFIDYIITDPFITPPDHHHFFAEQCILLPNTYQPNDRQRPISSHLPSKTECNLPEEGFIFCCFNNAFKITPEIFAVWMKLLDETPGSILWLLEGNDWASSNLRREAKANGIDPSRLTFAPRVAISEHLARHHLAGLFLDTVPYGAHTTASDALWAGLPVLTIAGDTFASRVAGSLLTAIGLPELITTSLSDYETLALRLAHRPDDLSALKKKLATNRGTMPLFDTPHYTRQLEGAYQQMWDSYSAADKAFPAILPADIGRKNALLG